MLIIAVVLRTFDQGGAETALLVFVGLATLLASADLPAAKEKRVRR